MSKKIYLITCRELEWSKNYERNKLFPMNYFKRLVPDSCPGKFDHIFKGEMILFQLKFIPIRFVNRA